MSMYKGLFESCTVTIDQNGEPIFPYYNQSLLEETAQSYVDENIGKLTPSYTLTINFYKENGYSHCSKRDLARCVKLKLETRINYLFSYEKEQVYMIQEGAIDNE